MPVRGVGVTDTASGAGVADVRARERTVDGGTYAEQYVIPVNERVASYKGTVTTFMTAGLASVDHNIFTIFNTTGSAVLVAVRRLTFQHDHDTAAITTVSPVVRTYRATAAPTGGSNLAKGAFDSTLSSAANVEIKGATASDGGAAAAITATANPAGAMWGQFRSRLHSLVGQVLVPDDSVIPALCDTDPVILRASEGLIVRVVQAGATSSRYVVNCMWEEFTLP